VASGLALALVASTCRGKGSGRGSAEVKPAAAKVPIVVEMARWSGPREILRLRSSGAEIGSSAGPVSFRFYASGALADDLWYFRRTYAPFRLEGPDLALAFRGEGPIPAGPIERRMITEWTRLVADEVSGEMGESSFGLALSAHVEGGAYPCDEVSVSLSGAVWAEPCPWGGEVRARLDPSRLAQLYAWFDALAPFQTSPGGGVESADSGESLRLVFAGRGKRVATPVEREEIGAYCQQLSRELRLRRPLAAGAAVSEPSGVSFLLPPEVSAGGRPLALLLDLPVESPAPPLRSSEPRAALPAPLAGPAAPRPLGPS